MLSKKEYQHLLEVRELVTTAHTTGTNLQKLSDGGDRFCLMGAVNHVARVPQINDSTVTRDKNKFWSREDWRARYAILSLIESKISSKWLNIEYFNDTMGKKAVLGVLEELIRENDPKGMDIGTPEKEYTVEPAEPIPGIKESPAPVPAPKEPVAPEREKVPA